MVPFRAFDREKREMWIVLNYHPSAAAGDQGTYLAALEDADERDWEMRVFSVGDLAKFRLVDFLEGDDGQDD